MTRLEELEQKLRPMQIRFVEEFEKDLNGTAAALRAGYGKGNAKSAAVLASRMLRNPLILAYRKERSKEIYERLDISRESLAARLMEIYRRCMQVEPVHIYRDGEWVESGEYQFDARGAAKALELLGKSIDLFGERVTEKHVLDIGPGEAEAALAMLGYEKRSEGAG